MNTGHISQLNSAVLNLTLLLVSHFKVNGMYLQTSINLPGMTTQNNVSCSLLILLRWQPALCPHREIRSAYASIYKLTKFLNNNPRENTTLHSVKKIKLKK